MNKDKTDNFSSLGLMGGCGSSGTTLLVHLVSRHAEVGSGPEFNCFNHPELYDIHALRKAWPRLQRGLARPAGYIDVPVFMTHRDHYQIQSSLIEAWLKRSSSTSEFVRLLQQHLQATLDCRIVLEKSPTNVYTFGEAIRALPGVRLIHVIRDGRDVAVSLMRRGFNVFGAGSRWVYDTLCGIAVRGHEQLLEVRYEEVVRDTDRVLDSVMQHLGVLTDRQKTADNCAVTRGLYSEDWKARAEPRVWNQTPADPISDRSIGQYRTTLKPEELSVLNRVRVVDRAGLFADLPRTFGELIEFLGYHKHETECTSHPKPSLDRRLIAEDYGRRLRRFTNRRQWSLPRCYTTID